jgi:F0F1-type ATP synthase assembly protein I
LPEEPPKADGPPPKQEGAGGDWTRALREAAPYLGIGTSLAATILLALWAGYWIDGKLGTRPAFFLLGGAFGLLAAFWNLYKTIGRRRP